MKVLLVNGSPHKKGCTNRALEEIRGTLEKNGIEGVIYHIGDEPIGGCIGCGVCKKTGCCYLKDRVNEFVALAKEADGFVFGSPVHYAAVAGSAASFMDRVFYSGKANFVHKPAAGVVSARRGGTTAAFDQLNKYFTISEMPIVSSQYWNMVHGTSPEDVEKDEEGLQIMRTLAGNMAWLLKSIEAGRKAGVEQPMAEPRVRTNFIG